MSDEILEEAIASAASMEKQRRHQVAKQRAYRELAKMHPFVFGDLLAKHKKQVDKEEESLHNGRPR